MSKCYKCGEQWTNENRVETPLLCPKCELVPTMKTITYEPSVGTRIEHACDEAVKLAKRGGATVRFKFNDVELTATPDHQPAALVDDWRRESDRLSEEYRTSPEGRAEAARRESQITTLKTQAAELLGKLDSVLAANSQDEIMDWLKSFAPISDDVSVKFDTAALAAKFEAAGFKENEGVGQEPDWFNTRDRMAGYIVGQVINCLKRGMPPHPVTVSFVEKYQAMPPVA